MPLRFYTNNNGKCYLSAELLRGVYEGRHVVSIKMRNSVDIEDAGFTGDSFIELYTLSYAVLYFKGQ
jgi:hypothetical protein